MESTRAKGRHAIYQNIWMPDVTLTTGVRINPVVLDNGRLVYVVYVPQSHQGHMAKDNPTISDTTFSPFRWKITKFAMLWTAHRFPP